LTGGGLIRSLGGWAEVRKYGLKGQEHIKSDERILGESDFVADILSQANEKFERNYELKPLGYDLDQVAARVAEIYGIEAEDIVLKGKQQKKFKPGTFFVFGRYANWESHLLSWPGVLGAVHPVLDTRL
jgi:putative transposase